MAGESNYAKSYEAKADEGGASKGKAKSAERGAPKAKAKAASRSAAQVKVKGAAKDAGAGASGSKRGLVIGIVALVVVIVAAAVAYNALAPGAAPQSLQTQGDVAERDAGTGASAGSGGDADADAAGSAAASGGQGKTQAPDFELTAVDGSTVSLGDMRGKPVVLNFWASTCGPCKMEMPEFQSAFEQYGDELQFAMVNVPDFNGETRERALGLVEQSGYTFPVYFDDSMQGQVQYGVTSIPQTYFINADGTVEAYASGAIDRSTLDRGIEMLLG